LARERASAIDVVTTVCSAHGAVGIELLVLHAAAFLAVVTLTPATELFPNNGDVLLYFQYAERVAQGEIPYRDIDLEYPPLALLPVVLPYLAWPFGRPSFETYQWLFVTQSAGLSVATAVIVAWVGRQRAGGEGMLRGMALYAVMAVATAPLLAWRFDLFPAMLGLGGVWLVLAGRPSLAGVAIGLGFAAKVFPVVLLPVLAIYLLAAGRWGSVGRLVAGFVVAATLVWLPISLAAPDEILSFAIRQQERPIQIESVQGGLQLLSHLLFGADIQVTFGFGSVNVIGRGTEQALDLQGIVSGLAIAGTLGLFFLRLVDDVRRIGAPAAQTLIDAGVAVMLALLLTNKVFSAQYIIWLLPLAALLRRPQAYLVVLASVLTLLVFPLNYERLIALEQLPIIALNVRNAVLVALLIILLVGPTGWARFRGCSLATRTGYSPPS